MSRHADKAPDARPAPAARPGRTRARLLVAAAAVVALAVGAGVTVELVRDDAQVLTLAGSDIAPGASGTAEIRDTPSGFEVVLDVEGLPAAAEGSYYQAWLKSDAGDLVTIGTFHAREGSDDVVLWSASTRGTTRR